MTLLHGTFNLANTNPILSAIRSLGFLNLETGPWVAGGCMRRIFSDVETGGDIDIFLPTSPTGIADRITLILKGRKDANVNKAFTDVSAMINHPSYTDFHLTSGHFQVITKRTFKNATDLIEDFDFTVAMAATDGWNWVADSRYFQHLREKRLVMNNTDQRKNKARRLVKYCLYGFTPDPGVITNIIGLNDPDFETKFSKNGRLNPANEY